MSSEQGTETQLLTEPDPCNVDKSPVAVHHLQKSTLNNEISDCSLFSDQSYNSYRDAEDFVQHFQEFGMFVVDLVNYVEQWLFLGA